MSKSQSDRSPSQLENAYIIEDKNGKGLSQCAKYGDPMPALLRYMIKAYVYSSRS